MSGVPSWTRLPPCNDLDLCQTGYFGAVKGACDIVDLDPHDTGPHVIELYIRAGHRQDAGRLHTTSAVPAASL